MVPAEQNERILYIFNVFVTFLFVPVLVTGLTYMHARFEIWRLDGPQAFSENLRQLAGHKQKGLWVPRRCVPCHICHAFSLTLIVKYHLKQYIAFCACVPPQVFVHLYPNVTRVLLPYPLTISNICEKYRTVHTENPGLL